MSDVQMDPRQFREWDQAPSTVLTTDEVIRQYENGRSGLIYDPQASEEFDSRMSMPEGEDVAYSMGFVESGQGKLITPFKNIVKAYPKALPGPGQTRGSCFLAGTQVKLADGSFKSIEDVKVNDRVLTHMGRERRVYELVEKDDNNGLVELYVAGHKIKATLDHKFLAERDDGPLQWVEAQDLYSGFSVFLDKSLEEPNSEYGHKTKVIKARHRKYSGKVYCINVEEDHSFIADGFVVHNCVADAAALALLGNMVQEVFSGLPDEISGRPERLPEIGAQGIKNKVLAFEPIYWFRGHGGDGWSCEAAANTITSVCGAIPRKDYTDSLGVNLERYSGALAGRYGRRRPPQNLIDQLDNNLFREATRVNGMEQCRDFLDQGYYILTCGGESWSNNRDENGFASRTRKGWVHAITLIGFDDRPEIKSLYKEPLALFLNTWGVWNRGGRKILGTNINIPHGAFWARWSDMKRRSMIAFSGLNGWAKKELPPLPDLSPHFI